MRVKFVKPSYSLPLFPNPKSVPIFTKKPCRHRYHLYMSSAIVCRQPSLLRRPICLPFSLSPAPITVASSHLFFHQNTIVISVKVLLPVSSPSPLQPSTVSVPLCR
ncbi:hypothetical protein ES288_D11G308200v1 [Gossypium darwinii]|uniref:Uncharacterized protein n=2 Tax=Gossypium TaxID=3633 RepID=A0A5D2IVH1_GOSTO|nr:hypothetical protein ES288_D11G308200v1 [Gossypium darwinii]TYH46079.1 hypothetical protein ES332_D11G310700v1 [Gossypium tomentosum]